MMRRVGLFFIICLFVYLVNPTLGWAPPPSGSHSPKVKPKNLKSVDSPSDGEIPSYDSTTKNFEWVTNAGAGGTIDDDVSVNSTGVDTTANLLDGDIDWTLVDGGAGGPDSITATLDPTYAATLGGGDVSAGANITDHAVVRGDGGAKGVQDSGVTIDDSGNITGTSLNATKLALADTSISSWAYLHMYEASSALGTGFRTIGVNVDISQDSAQGIRGGEFRVDKTSAGDSNAIMGVRAEPDFSGGSGTQDVAAGFYASAGTVATGGTVTDYYGIYAADGIDTGTITNNWAGYFDGAVGAQSIQDTDGPGTNWSIDASGNGTFAGTMGIGDTTPDHTLDVAGNIGLDASGYINFGDTDGTTGYGIRDNAGTVECKDSGGSWSACQDGAGGGSGDVTGVGDCASGACNDGTSDGGTYVRLYDGDSNYTELNNGDANQSADLKWVLPNTNGTAGQVLEIASVATDTITLEWDDDTTGAGSGAFDDTTDPVVLNTTSKDVHVGDGAGTLTGKLEIGGDADQPQLVVEGHSTQSDSIVVFQNDADTEVWAFGNDGNATFGDGTSLQWTFDVGANDPILAFTSGSIGMYPQSTNPVFIGSTAPQFQFLDSTASADDFHFEIDESVFVLTNNDDSVDYFKADATHNVTVGSASVPTINLTTDGTGTAEIVLPAGAIDSTEILDDTVGLVDIAHTATIAGNPALAISQCHPGANGIVCEGTAADTFEGLISFPVASSDKTVTIQNATHTIVGRATTDTLTNKTIDANGTGNSITNIDVADLATGTDGQLITWDASANPATVAVGTSGHVLTSNGAGAAPTFQAAGAASDTNAIKEFVWPAAATLPLEVGDNVAPIFADAGTNSDLLAVAFDGSSDECRTVNFGIPQDVDTSGNSVTFEVVWYDPAGSTASTAWDVRWHEVGDGEVWDAALTTDIIASCTPASGTADVIDVCSNSHTFADLAWAAGDNVNLQLCRDADGTSQTDSSTADSHLIEFRIRMPRA